MIVVADTTPVNYLILIGEIHVLEALYSRIVLPSAVRDELLHPRAPALVQAWTAQPPAWVEIVSPTLIPDFSFARLDKGEREAIALAIELSADQMIVDEIRGGTTRLFGYWNSWGSRGGCRSGFARFEISC
jgi:predicted nucleic acid-binding protein